jgi:hypothetical protein
MAPMDQLTKQTIYRRMKLSPVWSVFNNIIVPPETQTDQDILLRWQTTSTPIDQHIAPCPHRLFSVGHLCARCNISNGMKIAQTRQLRRSGDDKS